MTEQTTASRETPAATPISLVDSQAPQGGPRWAIIGIFFILLGGAFYLTAGFLLPVIMALLFTLVLSPVVRLFRRRLKVPEPVSAVVLVVGAVATLTFGFYMLSDPIASLINNAPKYAEAVHAQLETMQERIERFRTAQERADDPLPQAGGKEPAEVVIKSPGLLDNAASVVPHLGASMAFSLVFLFFLLASGDLFYVKLVKSMPTLSDKKRALHIAHEIEREVSRYLFTITMINVCLGTAVGLCLWWAGMPTPLIFGALATLLNFIPYLGPMAGMALVGVIALAEFGDLWRALLPVLLYFACTTLEGQFIQPMIVGRRLEMNAVAIFLAVAFWGWIWGVVGMFVAVPLMVGIKIFASYIEPLHPLADFLSVEKSVADEES